MVLMRRRQPLLVDPAETDGWFSAQSAEIYESSTETLFLGRQDAMQRSTLVPLARHLQGAGVQTGAGLKLLEVACGTGRFATYIKVCSECYNTALLTGCLVAVLLCNGRPLLPRLAKHCAHLRLSIALQDNWPELEITCMDLSPFYLAKARENMRYWCAATPAVAMFSA